MNYEALERAAMVIHERTGRSHDVALVLGSGLSGYAATLPHAIEIPYGEIPGFPVPSVHGHGGTLVSTRLGSGAALVFAGRVHFYEGWPLEKLVFGVRTALLAGCTRIILTNASGGCGDGLEAGDLVLITDHINLTGQSPLHGANDDRLGPRFPDMSTVYSPTLRALAHQSAAAVGTVLKEGVYAWFTGPSYETPAEVEMARRMGADLVGMSTVPEAVAARHMGAEVIGISLVTNLAAGISPTPLSHEEVTETAALARERFTSVVNELLSRMLS
jgi:purine-nucleoside phosphorylase